MDSEAKAASGEMLPEPVSTGGAGTVWDRLRDYAATQSGPFTSQEVLSWFRRHAPSKANERTVRTHIRGACWNVGDRSQFSHREPFLTRIDRGVFRRATINEIEQWRARNTTASTSRPTGATSEGTAAPVPLGPPSSGSSPQPQPDQDRRPAGEWYTEADVQSSLVTALVKNGWRILSVANTAAREHGIDVVAARDGQTAGIEVKGFPSRNYADPSRAGEAKRTLPGTQAGHGYAQAVLAAMRLRGKEPRWRSAIVLPDFPRYRELHGQTVASLSAAQIEVWWIDRSGDLHAP
ncbi:DUF7669 domain-containing protein [Intrasporangium oryzae]|nr:hypothetical protein [Intrasporangium oryzae]